MSTCRINFVIRKKGRFRKDKQPSSRGINNLQCISTLCFYLLSWQFFFVILVAFCCCCLGLLLLFWVCCFCFGSVAFVSVVAFVWVCCFCLGLSLLFGSVVVLCCVLSTTVVLQLEDKLTVTSKRQHSGLPSYMYHGTKPKTASFNDKRRLLHVPVYNNGQNML